MFKASYSLTKYNIIEVYRRNLILPSSHNNVEMLIIFYTYFQWHYNFYYDWKFIDIMALVPVDSENIFPLPRCQWHGHIRKDPKLPGLNLPSTTYLGRYLRSDSSVALWVIFFRTWNFEDYIQVVEIARLWQLASNLHGWNMNPTMIKELLLWNFKFMHRDGSRHELSVQRH